MKKYLSFCFFAFLIYVPLTVFSQTTLPTFFADHMVLQQQEKVTIWGWDNPGESITIKGSWNREIVAETDDTGKWQATLQTPEAGGPYTVIITGSNEIVLEDVMIGEVWIGSGQSNMTMKLSGYPNEPIYESGEAILRANQSNIRMYTASINASLNPLDDLEGTWEVSGTSTAPGFSAAAYFFGRYLEDILDVPVGLILTSWGGSSVEAWMDESTLRASGVTNFPDEIPDLRRQQTPTLLYNAMIHPLIPFTAKGFLWYQGESNVGNADQYTERFSNMIELWRKDFKNPNMPFYFAEIAPYNYGARNSAYLREAQLNTMKSVPNTGMAGTMDLGNCTNIHPPDKNNVGRRLALWALSQTYGLEGIEYSGPIYNSMEKTDDHKIILSFDRAENGFSTFGGPLTGFEIAGNDGNFVDAETTFNRGEKTISVWSNQVHNPQTVRYGFSNCPEANLYNLQKLPAPSFRTDQ